ncbi:MAG: DUF4230 domain-containing protein [Lachnospiraceae bacterium]|nr:DUF4230 domain-containing protein [Lachnospiraceae bacterium]
MKQNRLLGIACVVVGIAIILVVVMFYDKHAEYKKEKKNESGIEKLDLNSFITEDGGMRVSFSEVILSPIEEQRKLIVFKQIAKVNYTIEDRVFEAIDVDMLKQNQTVYYEAEGSFVVNLEEVTKEDIVEDKEKKLITIYVPHPKLDSIEIDPNRITFDDADKGTLVFTNLKITINDYVDIQKELQNRLQEKLDTTANGQEADDAAKEMVKQVYEPVIKAVDSDYDVVIDFKETSAETEE